MTVRAALLAEVPDAVLMARVQRGDQAAYAALIGRHRPEALAVALVGCHHRERAEDAVQEAFCSLWRSRATYDPASGAVGAWLMTIVRNQARTNARRAHAEERPAAGSDRPHPSALQDPATTALLRADAAALLARVVLLPAAQREVIGLAFYGQLSHGEIAGLLHLPVGTVKGRIRLGLDRLRIDGEPVSTRTSAG